MSLPRKRESRKTSLDTRLRGYDYSDTLSSMKLADGLEKYRSHPAFYSFTLPLESQARKVIDLLAQYGDNPNEAALAEVKNFLIEVEKWKAGCLQQRMGNAVKNPAQSIWQAFQGAASSISDVQTLLSIMQLKGFGSSVDDETGQRRAKVATSVLRFLWPDKWGVVDWRVAVILGLLTKHAWDIDQVLSEAKKRKAEVLRKDYDLINEQAACEINEQYRQISQSHSEFLPRAADVDMAIFGISLMAWPMP